MININFDELTKTISTIKSELNEMIGRDIKGSITFTNFKAKFIIPPPFKKIVKNVAYELKLPIKEEGIVFYADSTDKLTEILDKILKLKKKLEKVVVEQE
ncbi:MAG: hypothetical protein ACTSRZ_19175 [Promethearchaeota archaeon]